MVLNSFFEPIYKATTRDLYYPSRKNTGIFVTKFFVAGGSNLFYLPRGIVKADQVETQRKIYNNGDLFSKEKKRTFCPLNRNALSEFLFSCIPDDRCPQVMNEYGIPVSLQVDKRCLSNALVSQFESFLKSDIDYADDIISMEYERFLVGGASHFEAVVETHYQDDIALPSSRQCRLHNVTTHDKNILHEWIIQNRGKREWHGRKLYFANCQEVIPRANTNYVDVPDTLPGEFAKMTVSMDARRHEGETLCHWIMLDAQNNDCFPNSTMFDFTLDATFVYVPKNMEG